MNSSIYWFIHPWGLTQRIIIWICDALCVSLCLVCALVVRRVRAAMVEEEEEEAAAATPSLREQGNIHNASFTAEKNLPRSTVKLSKSRSRKCRALQVLLSFALSTSYTSKPTCLCIVVPSWGLISCALSCMRRQVFFSLFHFLSIFKAELIS